MSFGIMHIFLRNAVSKTVTRLILMQLTARQLRSISCVLQKSVSQSRSPLEKGTDFIFYKCDSLTTKFNFVSNVDSG